jgi:hypothetical protein
LFILLWENKATFLRKNLWMFFAVGIIEANKPNVKINIFLTRINRCIQTAWKYPLWSLCCLALKVCIVHTIIFLFSSTKNEEGMMTTVHCYIYICKCTNFSFTRCVHTYITFANRMSFHQMIFNIHTCRIVKTQPILTLDYVLKECIYVCRYLQKYERCFEGLTPLTAHNGPSTTSVTRCVFEKPAKM